MRFQTQDAEHSAKFAEEYKTEVKEKTEMLEAMGGDADKFADQEAEINTSIENTIKEIDDEKENLVK